MIAGAVCAVSDDGVVIFWCPGCETYHGVWTKTPNEITGALWTWNGDRAKPTFAPSILVHAGERTPRCHSFVRDGVIEFCGDCDHALRGQSVTLVPDRNVAASYRQPE